MMKTLLAATALSSLALVTSPAFAADAAPAAQNANGTDSSGPGSNGPGVGEIVVTAQKRSENIQNVPIAISAVSGQYLETRGITSIDNLGSIAPNMQIARAPSDKTITQISIRGSVTINPAVTWEPAVGLYLNGVYIAKAQGSVFDVADLERIEVLRGPQGTLYGRNALAGAVNLVPKAPTGKFDLAAEASYGNYNYWKGKLVLDLPEWQGFSVKLSGQIEQRDGFIKVTGNPAYNSINNLDSKSAMVQVRYRPAGSAVTADYMFDYSNHDQRPDYSQLYSVYTDHSAYAIFDPKSASYSGIPLAQYASTTRQTTTSLDANPEYEKSETWGHALTLSVPLGSATLKSITSYRWMHWQDSTDLDGSPLPVAFTQRNTRFHSFSQELQATGKALNDRLNYVAGLFYYSEFAATDNPQSYFFGSANYLSVYGSHTKAFAAYTQADYNFTEQLKLTVGARYTHEQKDIRKLLVANGTTVADINYGDVPDAKYDSFTPAVTLSYQPDRNINVYARYARGFKSGGFNGETNIFFDPNAPKGCIDGATELCHPYKPETVDSYEVGVKTRLLDGKMILNLAAFWDEHRNIQLSVFTASGAAASEVLNAAGARVRGLEAELTLRPIDAITFHGSAAYLDPKYESYIDGGVDVSGNRAFPHAPHYTASASLDARLAQGDWGRFSVSGDLNYTSSYFTFPYALTGSQQTAWQTQAPAQIFFNARATIAQIPMGGTTAQVSLWGKNLFNFKKPDNFIDFGTSFGGLTVAYFPDPRTYGVTIGVKF
ncbi:TonB-dependent receptor [Novosphingobium sp. Fuku2-ISO-50]|uniref:TonB-dependent receptor n=1 Tax=Novosphingobium sp. Fuku2-ISO-50 TaxID=1739114 RepID=UPI001E43E8F4|nr:TonB-dependent receptor [Novosphingobium sp. Fuku2-ISO-50]